MGYGSYFNSNKPFGNNYYKDDHYNYHKKRIAMFAFY